MNRARTYRLTREVLKQALTVLETLLPIAKRERIGTSNIKETIRSLQKVIDGDFLEELTENIEFEQIVSLLQMAELSSLDEDIIDIGDYQGTGFIGLDGDPTTPPPRPRKKKT